MPPILPIGKARAQLEDLRMNIFVGSLPLTTTAAELRTGLHPLWHRRTRPYPPGSGDRPFPGLWLCRDARRHPGAGGD